VVIVWTSLNLRGSRTIDSELNSSSHPCVEHIGCCVTPPSPLWSRLTWPTRSCRETIIEACRRCSSDWWLTKRPPLLSHLKYEIKEREMHDRQPRDLPRRFQILALWQLTTQEPSNILLESITHTGERQHGPIGSNHAPPGCTNAPPGCTQQAPLGPGGPSFAISQNAWYCPDPPRHPTHAVERSWCKSLHRG
jgi:hypothetical protein